MFTKGTFAANVATLSSGTALGQLSVILAAPLLSRVFAPSDFGELQYILSIALILGALSTLRFEMALPLARKVIDGVHILILAISLAVILATISLIFFIVDPPVIRHVYDSIEMKSLIYFVPLILLLEANGSVFTFWFTRSKNFKAASIGKIFQGVGVALAQVAFALAGVVNGFGLLAGYVMGQLASVGWYIYMFFKTTDPISASKISLNAMIAQAKLHKKFPLFSSWNILFNTIARNLPPLLMVSYFSVVEAGYYALGIRLLNIPINTLGMSVGHVYYQQIARYYDQGIAIRPLFFSTARKLAVIIAIPMLLVFFYGGWLFGVVFGEKWTVAGELASIMAPFYVLRFISSPLSTVFSVIGKQYVGPIWQAIYAAGTFAAFYLTKDTGNIFLSLKVYSFVGMSIFGMLLIITYIQTIRTDKHLQQKAHVI